MEEVFFNNQTDYFTFYSAGDFDAPCAIICPGGGYHHTSARESKNVADQFLLRKMHAVVINYREALDLYPTPMDELGYAITYVRKNARRLHVKKDKIISIGFSAGAHLTLTNAIYYDEFGEDARPNYLVLCYPVISSDPKIAHLASFDNLLGDKKSPELLDKLSLEKHIPENLPDMFLWHTFTDESVNVENSLRLMIALKEKGNNVEAHIFPEGLHGMSLADDTTTLGDPRKKNPYIHRWVSMMFEWFIKKNIK